MVLRINDERSSELCKKIESYAIKSGGLEFPFTVDDYTFNESDLDRGLTNSYHKQGFKTEVFHNNCRCSLVPISDTMSKSIKYNQRFDDIDRMMSIDSALSYVAETKLSKENPSLFQKIGQKISIKSRQLVNYVKNLFK